MKPLGLQHLNSLFTTARSAEADGVSIIEAAGDVGEARLVARQLRTWIESGIAPSSIIVAGRDLPAKAALLREVFDEYDVPANVPVPEVLSACGVLGLLRKVWSLPERDFLFREVTAVWRNSYFQPQFAADLPLRAEGLLRELKVPRGRIDYLNAILTTAEDRLPLPLEDESMESKAREDRSQLAKRCLGFTQWFFDLWEPVQASAPPRAMVAQLHRLADAIGLNRSPLPGEHDASALETFWTTLEARATAARAPTVSPGQFARVLDDILAKTAWPKPAHENAIRVLTVEDAANAECSHLILLGLGERSFPDIRSASEVEVAMLREKELFKSIITKPSQAVVFSYAALDAKGQTLLASPFLKAVKALFVTIPTLSQSMLLDGYLTWPPISVAERRTQNVQHGVLSEPLRVAKQMADSRFRNEEPNEYVGRLNDPNLLNAVAAKFPAEHVFSATSLESYVGCPFRFGMQKLLRLEPLEEPDEDVDVSQRGTAIHRALRRFHAAKPHERPQRIVQELADSWSVAVNEEVERSPGAVAKMIWNLERRRVQRALDRYPKQWNNYRFEWRKQGALPVPNKFEAMFGYNKPECQQPPLKLEVDGVPVRIGGIIDRVDLAKLDDGYGFWIIDYKSGGTAFTSGELLRFEKLQLPLYAMAVERLFHANDTVRPLGLAYWLVVKDGPKRMLPAGRNEYAWADSAGDWPEYRAKLERVVVKVVANLRSGDFRLAPRNRDTCQYCDYSKICRINQLRERFTPLPLVGEHVA